MGRSRFWHSLLFIPEERRIGNWWRGGRLKPSNQVLLSLEIVILLGIVIAFVLPAIITAR